MLDVDGKFDSIIEDEDESFDCEKMVNPFELIAAFRKFAGNVKTIVSENENGFAICKDILPVKDDWTRVFLVD